MALSSRASSVSTNIPEEKVEQWSDLVYNRAKEEPPDTLLTQDDLLSFGVVSDLKHLMVVVNKLVSENLFKVMSQGGQNAWKWRSEEDAKKISSIPNREYRLIYEFIDDAGSDGIWARSIRYRAHISDLGMKNGLKWLENKGFVCEFKSVEHPNKKMYIKSSLRPSEKATGGPWFTDGQLDVGYLNSMQQVVFFLIKEKSVYLSKRSASGSTGSTDGKVKREKQPTKGAVRGIQQTSPGTKRSADKISTDAPTTASTTSPTDASKPPTAKSKRGATGPRTLPLPAGYTKYPTTLNIVQFINGSNMTRDPVTREPLTLTQGDMQQIIDILVWENRVEPVRLSGGRTGYRATRPAQIPATKDDENDEVLGVAQERSLNGFSEIPCSHCPVFDICVPGGEVSPAGCRYYEEWLKSIE